MKTAIAQFFWGALGFVVLVGFSLVGQWLAPLLPIALPAPLIGMLLLLMALVINGKTPAGLDFAAKPLLGHMSLLFVPAILGIWHYQELIRSNWLALSLAVVVTTIVALAVTAWLMEKIQRSTH